MSPVPPGWYADPAAGPAWLRWWDGFRWTDHVAPAAAPTAPAAPSAPAAPAPSRTAAPTGPTTPDGVPLAGWWWRVLAYFVDGVVVAIPNAILTLPAQIGMQRQMQELMRELQSDSANGQIPDYGAFFSDYLAIFRDHALWLFLPGAVLFTAYFAVMWRWRGATVGQLVCGLQVRPLASPERPSVPMVLVRVAVLYLLPTAVLAVGMVSGSWAALGVAYAVAMLFQLANVLWPLWDRRRQALHDKAARTVVVRPAR